MPAEHELIPRHLEIAESLQSDIERGIYRLGDKIPSESELCRRFQENRYTVRRALELLVNMGIVRSHQGKGHFVCDKPLNIRYTITTSTCFSQIMTQLGCRPEARLLRKEVSVPPEHVVRTLQLANHEQAYRLEILRYANRIPLTYNVTWLPVSAFPDLLTHLEPMHSLYAIFESRYGVTPVRMKSSFRATFPSALEAGYLHIPPNQNVLHIESVMRDDGGRLVEYTSAKYRGDLCCISIEF